MHLKKHSFGSGNQDASTAPIYPLFCLILKVFASQTWKFPDSLKRCKSLYFYLGDFWKRISQFFRRVGGEAAHPPKKLGNYFLEISLSRR
jgi:hypothetical protein